MEDDKLLHTITIGGDLSSGCHLKWSEDCVVALSAVNGVHLFELSPYSNSCNESSPFVVRRDVIPPPDEVKERDYDIDMAEMLKKPSRTREDLHNLKLNRFPSFGFYYNNSFKGFQDAVWSPKGIGPFQTCCLAVLTSDHWLALYGRSKSWEKIVVLSDLFYEHLKKDNFSNILMLESENNYSENVKNCSKISATSSVEIVWSHGIKLNENEDISFSCLFTAQKNGLIVIWKVIPCKVFPNEVEVWSIYNADVGVICSLHWIELNKTSGFLFVGGITGQCHAFEIHFDNSIKVIIKPKIVLWADKDMLSVASIGSYKRLETTYIICAKGCYLIAWKLENLKISKICHYSGDNVQFVTGLAETSDGILLSTADGILFKIQVNCDKNAIVCDRMCLNLVNKDQTYNGICTSPNKIVACVIKSIGSSYDHLLVKESLILAFFTCTTEEDIFFKFTKLTDVDGGFITCRDLLFYFYYNYKKNLDYPPYLLSLIQNEEIVLQNESSSKLQLLRWICYFIRFIDPENEETIVVLIPKSNIIERILIQRKLLTYLKRVYINDDKSRLHNRITNIIKWCKKNVSDFTALEMSTVNKIAEKFNDSTVENNEEVCPICKSTLESLKHGRCLNGHVLGRCSISLFISKKNEQMKCTKCSLFANSDALALAEDYSCPFCYEIMS